MNEIYGNVGKVVKNIAESAWKLASIQTDPVAASNFLDNVTKYYSHILTEEEIGFLQFYFNMQLEMMKE